MKLLITSVGSLVGQNILEVLNYSREYFEIIGTNSTAKAAIYGCDRTYLVGQSEKPPSEYAEQLMEIINDENPDLVIPARDIDITILAMLGEKYPGYASKFLCGTAELANMMDDKWLSYLFAEKNNLPFAKSAIPDFSNENKAVYELVKNCGYPLIVKPRSGFASREVKLINNEVQLKKALTHENIIFEEYLGNPRKVKQFNEKVVKCGTPLHYSLEEHKYSIQTIIHPDKKIEEICETIHVMKCGISTIAERIHEPELMELGENYAHVLASKGWIGPVNIQCQKDSSGKFSVYELNGRMTGATAARYYLGYDELSFIFNAFLNIKLPHNRRFNSQSKAIKKPVISLMDDESISILKKYGKWDNQHELDLEYYFN